MTRRRTILPVDSQNETELELSEAQEIIQDDGKDEFHDNETEEQFWGDDDLEDTATLGGDWLVPTLAIGAALGWTGFFVWVHRTQIIAGASAEQWIGWISQWSLPIILLIGLWLLAMRNSRREANRFNDAARALAQESAQLESRLSVVNRELALARDFIASQSRDLESLGRLANERLSANADRLQTLIHDNHAQVEAIGSVSDTALSNMESLRDQLPVVANAARDMSNQIGNAGNVAQEHIEALVAGFDRLNQFGEVSEQHVNRISETVGSTLELFDNQMTALGEATQERFEKLRRVSEGFRADLAMSQEEAIASIRTRAAAIAEELRAHDIAQRENEQAALAAMRERLDVMSGDGERVFASLADGREDAVRLWNEAIAALEGRMAQAIARVSQADEEALASATERLAALDERIAGFDQRVSERQEAMTEHISALVERSEALAQRMAELDSEMQQLAGRGAETREGVSEAAQELADRLEQSRSVLEDNGKFVANLTDDSVRLLEIIRSGADHSQGALSDAILQAEQRLVSFGEEAARLQGVIEETEARGAALSGHISQANEGSNESLEKLAAIQGHIESVAAQSERLAERTGTELRDAVEQLSGKAVDALTGLRDGQREVIAEIAERIAEDSQVRIAEAIRQNARETIAELEAAVARAAENGHATTAVLREQLGRVNELATNLEQRIEYARERAEEKVEHDFSRRMALITEALNSSAIDIAKAFENEVSDTQWAHYLRGDRGIFTRRAVRLLDRQESRAVADVYGEDAEFRETVNRYIHDFEAMLREVLSTRDGNAMAVTLLSSDIGKLYVALAQAIDRLRN